MKTAVAILGSNIVSSYFLFFVARAGDINLDGIVDISDAILASIAYGSLIGDPNWNALADLDGNGIVDIFDMILLASESGRGR